MKLLVLHRIPYSKINYHLGIDHTNHDVTYIGVAKALETIPRNLRCMRVTRPGRDNVAAEVIAWAQAKSAQFDRVISMSEYELLDAARVRETLGIAGPLLHDVLKVRDKLLMKKLVVAAGLPAPMALPLEELIQSPPFWSGKTVLKPIDGASSEDVVVFSSVSTLTQAVLDRCTGVQKIDAYGLLKGYEAEQFISGPIMHFDGFIWQGHIQVVVGSRYVGNCLDYAQGEPMGSVQFDMSAERRLWVQKVIRAVGIEEGAFHLEAIEDERHSGEQLIFLEIANRIGAADVVITFELATGIHLPSVVLAMVTGQTPQVSACPSGSTRFGWFVFPGHHLGMGTCQLSGHEAYRQHPSVRQWNELASHTELPRHITYQSFEVPAAGVIATASHEEGVTMLRQMFTNIRVQAVPHLTDTALPSTRPAHAEIAL